MKQFITLLLTILVFTFTTHAQNVGIGTNTPDSSALLDLQSTSKGLLLPRMSYSERIAVLTPKTGLMVYQHDNGITARGFYTYGADGWKRSPTQDEISGGGLWTLNGSNELISNQPGFVGINTNDPSYQLDVNGSIHSKI